MLWYTKDYTVNILSLDDSSFMPYQALIQGYKTFEMQWVLIDPINVKKDTIYWFC